MPDPQFRQVPPLRPPADREAVAAAARLLEQATRPVIIAGGGARLSDAGPELAELAQRLAIPVATSLNSKDVIQAIIPSTSAYRGCTVARALIGLCWRRIWCCSSEATPAVK